jgi:hypothetical protein
MDSDKILVMNYGVAAEFDSPLKLLEMEKGIFRSLVEADGPETTQRLVNMAKGIREDASGTGTAPPSSETPLAVVDLEPKVSLSKVEVSVIEVTTVNMLGPSEPESKSS